jgi:acyl carrier protein
MTEAELAALVREALRHVAPDIEGQEIDPGEKFRDQFEIDSMDFLNFVIGLHKATGVPIPEADYEKLTTLSDCVAYLKARLSAC